MPNRSKRIKSEKIPTEHQFPYIGTDGQPYTYHVFLHADNVVCYDYKYVPITVYPVPTASISHNHQPPTERPICGDDVIFTVSDLGIGNSTTTVYRWNYGDYLREYPNIDPSVGSFTEPRPDPNPDPVTGPGADFRPYKFENWISTSPLTRTVTLTTLNTNYLPEASLEYGNFPAQRPLECASSRSLVLTIYPQVEADFHMQDDEACYPINDPLFPENNVRFISTSLGINPTLVWEFRNQLTGEVLTFDRSTVADPRNISPTFPEPASFTEPVVYDVTLTATGSLGRCISTSSPVRTFTVNPQPDANFRVTPDDGCHPLTVTFINTSANDPNSTDILYRFDFRNGNTVETRNYNALINPELPPPHRYTVTEVFNNSSGEVRLVDPSPTMTAINQFGCARTAPPVEIRVQPFVHAQFSLAYVDPRDEQTLCTPLNMNLLNSSLGYTHIRINWGDGKPAEIKELTDGIIFPHTFEAPNMYERGEYTVTLTAYRGNPDDAQCSSVATLPVTVNPTPTAAFRLGPPYPADFWYPAPPITIINDVATPDRYNGLSYRWSYREVVSGIPSIWENTFDTAIDPMSLRLDTWGEFNVIQRVTANVGGCSNSMTIPIKIIAPAVNASFEPDILEACVPQRIQFNNTSRYTRAYFWEFGDGFTSSERDPVHTYQSPGEWEVTLTVWGHNPQESSRSMTRTITVHPTPQAGFQVAPNFTYVGMEVTTSNSTVTTFNVRDKDGIRVEDLDVWYEWDFGDGSPIKREREPTHRYLRSGTFEVMLTVGTNSTDPVCSSNFTFEVQIGETGEMMLPNVFKPNADGEVSDEIPSGGYRNFLFYSPVHNETESYRMRIYNRHGILLFDNTDINRGWNGYYQGVLMEEGVYFYRIEGVYKTGQPFLITGDVMLMR